MKKILSILTSIGLVATASSTVVACGKSSPKVEQKNGASNLTPEKSKDNSNDSKSDDSKDNSPSGPSKPDTSNVINNTQYDQAFENWNKTKSSFIKSFLTNNIAVQINKDQKQTIDKNKSTWKDNVTNDPNLNNETNLKSKIAAALAGKIYSWGLIENYSHFNSNKLSITFTSIRNKDGYTDFDAPVGSTCWTAKLSYFDSKNVFTLNGWFVPTIDDFKTLSEINDSNISSAIKEAKAYDSNGKNINGPGYFLSLDFVGEKDDQNWLKNNVNYKIDANKANSKELIYLFSYLKSLGIVDTSYNPSLSDYDFDLLPNVDENGISTVTSSVLNGSRSWVKPSTVTWDKNKNYSINLVGSILINGYQY